ncbi:MAG: sialate O-acetylesterase [Pyrinomonadaceae bacterium]
MRKITFLVFAFSVLFSIPVEAKLAMPAIFSENMVLQRDVPITVWGWATPGERVVVKLNGKSSEFSADANGKWKGNLSAQKAGGPYVFEVQGKDERLSFGNVLIGEVWICGGQSNMEWSVGQSMNAKAELAASTNPRIRQIKVPRLIDGIPHNDFPDGKWKLSEPANTMDFTAAGYFFAKRIEAELKVPVGLVNVSWGGTNIETWISRQGFESSKEFRELIGRMPVLDVSKVDGPLKTVAEKKVEARQGMPVGGFDVDQFKSADYDGSELKTMSVPEFWEKQGLENIDGVVWLRKSFYLDFDPDGKEASVLLGKIDDEDVTYINTIEVGAASRWNMLRKYDIKSGVLKKGRNVIAVKVTDSGGGGGIYGKPDEVSLSVGDETISLAGDWQFRVESVRVGINVNQFPSLAYNAMINPVAGYSTRGFLWYQGEANASRAYQYRTAFPLLIDDWRGRWGDKKLPFYFVQLATYKTPGDSNAGSAWAELREAQAMTSNVPGAGMVVTTDIGNPGDIHPTNKQEVGKRLAALALNRTYGRKMVDSGPVYKSMKIKGMTVILSFANPGKGLKAGSDNLGGFEIAGEDKVFHKATAKIVGGKVHVKSDEVASPKAVRFGWVGDASEANLFNIEGFPSVPFRTDDWNTSTINEKYSFPDIN